VEPFFFNIYRDKEIIMGDTSKVIILDSNTNDKVGEASKPKGIHPEDKKTSAYRIKTTIAGGLAGCLAKSAIAPMDRVKILFQTSHPNYLPYQKQKFGFFKAINHIYKAQGIKGLFKGHSATLIRIFPYAGIKFTMYEQFRVYLNPSGDGRYTFISGTLAGLVAVLVTYPVELVRIKSAFDESGKNIFAVCKDIYSSGILTEYAKDKQKVHSNINTAIDVQRLLHSNLNIAKDAQKVQHPNLNSKQSPLRVVYGLACFYKGIVPTLIGIIPYAGVSFYSYETLKQKLATIESLKQNPSVRTLLCGALSGVIAQSCSYPIEVIRRNMQVGKGKGLIGEFGTIITTTKQIYSVRGIRGFFAGLGIGYLKVTPMFAVSFYSYEYFKTAFGIN
jgi:solute carrier family 25 protein 16